MSSDPSVRSVLGVTTVEGGFDVCRIYANDRGGESVECRVFAGDEKGTRDLVRWAEARSPFAAAVGGGGSASEAICAALAVQGNRIEVLPGNLAGTAAARPGGIAPCQRLAASARRRLARAGSRGFGDGAAASAMTRLRGRVSGNMRQIKGFVARLFELTGARLPDLYREFGSEPDPRFAGSPGEPRFPLEGAGRAEADGSPCRSGALEVMELARRLMAECVLLSVGGAPELPQDASCLVAPDSGKDGSPATSLEAPANRPSSPYAWQGVGKAGDAVARGWSGPVAVPVPGGGPGEGSGAAPDVATAGTDAPESGAHEAGATAGADAPESGAPEAGASGGGTRGAGPAGGEPGVSRSGADIIFVGGGHPAAGRLAKAACQLQSYWLSLRVYRFLLDLEIRDMMAGQAEAFALLKSFPGLSPARVAGVLSELGPCPERFPDADSLCRWAGYGEPAEVGASGRGRGRSRLSRALRSALRQAGRKSPRFRRFLGAPESAGTCPADLRGGERALLRVIYEVLVTGRPYKEEGDC
ncbi:MAG: IS110 family transposase [Deltaproteobacteria bacterium]|nr:IS110 family transposase [Deltaproteobacteria bacterium]